MIYQSRFFICSFLRVLYGHFFTIFFLSRSSSWDGTDTLVSDNDLTYRCGIAHRRRPIRTRYTRCCWNRTSAIPESVFGRLMQDRQCSFNLLTLSCTLLGYWLLPEYLTKESSRDHGSSYSSFKRAVKTMYQKPNEQTQGVSAYFKTRTRRRPVSRQKRFLLFSSCFAVSCVAFFGHYQKTRTPIRAPFGVDSIFSSPFIFFSS